MAMDVGVDVDMHLQLHMDVDVDVDMSMHMHVDVDVDEHASTFRMSGAARSNISRSSSAPFCPVTCEHGHRMGSARASTSTSTWMSACA